MRILYVGLARRAAQGPTSMDGRTRGDCVYLWRSAALPVVQAHYDNTAAFVSH